MKPLHALVLLATMAQSIATPNFGHADDVRDHYLTEVPRQKQDCQDRGGHWDGSGCVEGAENSDGGSFLGQLVTVVVIGGLFCLATGGCTGDSPEQ